MLLLYIFRRSNSYFFGYFYACIYVYLNKSFWKSSKWTQLLILYTLPIVSLSLRPSTNDFSIADWLTPSAAEMPLSSTDQSSLRSDEPPTGWSTCSSVVQSVLQEVPAEDSLGDMNVWTSGTTSGDIGGRVRAERGLMRSRSLRQSRSIGELIAWFNELSVLFRR